MNLDKTDSRTRPDLDAIETRKEDWEPYLQKDRHWSSASIALLLSDQEKLIARIRDLEAENKRLSERAENAEYYLNEEIRQD